MSLPEELDEEIGPKDVDEELTSPEQEIKDDVYHEHFDEFHFAFLMDFYELIPMSSVLLQCNNQQLCSLIMISIPDHLVSLFKKSQQQPATEQKDVSELSEIERGPLSYIAGYVLSQLRKKSSNDELQLLLQSMMCPSSENTYIETRSRGGLVTPCNDLVHILEVGEGVFRQLIAKQSGVVKSIPCDKLQCAMIHLTPHW